MAGKGLKRPPGYESVTVKGLPKESWKQRDAFETYLCLGPGRTLPELAKCTNRPLSTLRVWSAEFNWNQRIMEYDNKILQKLSRYNLAKYQERLKEKHLKMYAKAQEVAMGHLEKNVGIGVGFENHKDAIVALDVAIKGERNAAGMEAQKLKAGIMKDGFAAWVEAVSGAQAGQAPEEAEVIPELENPE